MSQLTRNTAAIAIIGPEEPEVGGIGREPLIQCPETAATLVVAALQSRPRTFDQHRAIDDVQVGAPMVTAGARQCRPQQDGLHQGALFQGRRIQQLFVAIQQRPLATELAVPDRQLLLEAAEGGHRPQIQPVVGRRRAHGDQRLAGKRMQGTGQFEGFRNMRPGASRQRQQIQARKIAVLRLHGA